VRGAECRQEILEGVFVGQVDHAEPDAQLRSVRVQDAVGADAQIEQVPQGDPGWIQPHCRLCLQPVFAAALRRRSSRSCRWHSSACRPRWRLVSSIGCFNVSDLVNLLIESESKNAA